MAFQKASEAKEARKNNQLLKKICSGFEERIPGAITAWEEGEEDGIKAKIKRPDSLGFGVFEKSKYAIGLIKKLKAASYHAVHFAGEGTDKGEKGYITLCFTP